MSMANTFWIKLANTVENISVKNISFKTGKPNSTVKKLCMVKNTRFFSYVQEELQKCCVYYYIAIQNV